MINVKYIKKIRENKEISQVNMAERLGMSRGSYIAVEKNEKELTITQAKKLATILGVTLDELLGRKKNNKKKYEQMLVVFLRNLDGDKKITKTKLAKLLYLADFAWYYENLESMSGMEYRKIAHGPVPDYYFMLLEELEGDGKIKVENKKSALMISETRTGEKVKDDLLNSKEKNLIVKISKKWKNKNTKEIVDFTHNQTPYVFADDKDIIPYELITQEEERHVY